MPISLQLTAAVSLLPLSVSRQAIPLGKGEALPGFLGHFNQNAHEKALCELPEAMLVVVVVVVVMVISDGDAIPCVPACDPRI